MPLRPHGGMRGSMVSFLGSTVNELGRVDVIILVQLMNSKSKTNHRRWHHRCPTPSCVVFRAFVLVLRSCCEKAVWCLQKSSVKLPVSPTDHCQWGQANTILKSRNITVFTTICPMERVAVNVSHDGCSGASCNIDDVAG